MMYGLLILNFIVPAVMLMAAYFLKRKKRPYPGPVGMSVKWKVDFSGYNTPLSRKSRDHWDYAQTVAPERFFKWAKWSFLTPVLMTVLGAVLAPVSPNAIQHAVIFGVGSGFYCMIVAFQETEKALKERFGA